MKLPSNLMKIVIAMAHRNLIQSQRNFAHTKAAQCCDCTNKTDNVNFLSNLKLNHNFISTMGTWSAVTHRKLYNKTEKITSNKSQFISHETDHNLFHTTETDMAHVTLNNTMKMTRIKLGLWIDFKLTDIFLLLQLFHKSLSKFIYCWVPWFCFLICFSNTNK